MHCMRDGTALIDLNGLIRWLRCFGRVLINLDSDGSLSSRDYAKGRCHEGILDGNRCLGNHHLGDINSCALLLSSYPGGFPFFPFLASTDK
jgi:hypothetical protein